MTTAQCNRLIERLEQDGFDQCCQTEEGHVHVGCSQCEALCINSTATHETGCPNWRQAKEEAEQAD